MIFNVIIKIAINAIFYFFFFDTTYFEITIVQPMLFTYYLKIFQV